MEINKLTITTGNIQELFTTIKNGLSNGTVKGTDVTAFIKIFEKQIKRVKAEAQELALQEMGDASYSVFGVELTRKNGARYYDFTNSSDWVEVAEKKKQMEAHLKIGEWINPETGNINPKAITKFRADSLVGKQ